jgi:hypothetical protein
MKSEKGIEMAVASSTGRTVRLSRYRKIGGRAIAGMMSTNNNGRSGITEGRGRGCEGVCY